MVNKLLYQILTSTQKNFKKSYQKNKYKKLVRKWNDNFELLDGSHILFQTLKITLKVSLKNVKHRLIMLQ